MSNILDKLLEDIGAGSLLKSTAMELPSGFASADVINSVKRKKTKTDDDICKIEKQNIKIDCSKIRLRPCNNRSDYGVYWLREDEIYEHAAHMEDQAKYKPSALNAGQKKIWDYISNNKTSIVLIQAGPGCGKTYTLKTIAYGMAPTRFDTIIFKHDLLESFKYNSRRFTVASFVTAVLGIRYFNYLALDKLLSSSITEYDFMLVIISMIKRSALPSMMGSIVLFDEYTIVSKPILLLTMILLEYHGIGAIICGDKNQLQNIFNSKHAPISSYTLAASFAKQQFTLNVNERCSDTAYNNLIAYISQYSSGRRLDAYAYAMVSVIFLRQLIEPQNYHHLHLAGTHQELSDLAHSLVCNNQYATDFYAIDQSNLRKRAGIVRAVPGLHPTQALLDYNARIANNSPPKVDKFLPYIPLVVGARYYVFKHSEHCQGVLQSINPDNTLTLKMDNGTYRIVCRSTRDAVLFGEHRLFLMNGELGKLYAYPVYPANFMSIHKCQGCTITENLDLMLHNTQYQGLYVALSRVTDPKQIARVVIPDQISHIVSSIINFKHHVEGRQVTSEELQQGMINYMFYNVNGCLDPFLTIITDFILSTDVNLKRELRDKIITLAKSCPTKILSFDDHTAGSANNLLTMSMIIKYRDVFLAVSCLDELDRNVWLHEYILANSELRTLLPSNFVINSVPVSQFENRELNELIKLANLTEAYSMEMSTIEYIKSKSTQAIRRSEEDRKSNKKFVISSLDTHLFYESSEFCAKIYKKLTSGDAVSDVWLIEELDYMLGSFGNETTSQPEKTIDRADRSKIQQLLVKRRRKI